jgi:hypothetical protein
MSERKEQVISSIAEQMRAHAITLDEVKAALAGEVVAPGRGDLAGRVFGTLGAIFIFAGVGIYISMFWAEMNSAMRIIATLGVGLALHAFTLTGDRRQAYPRAAAPLLLIGIVMQTTGWFVAIDELFNSGSDPRYAVLFVMAVMGTQQWVIFRKFRLTLLLFATLCFGYGFVLTVFDLMNADRTLVLLVLGISMLALAQRIRQTPHASISGLGYFVGSVTFLVALFDLLQGTPVELLYFGVTAGLIYASTLARSTALLTVGTLAMLSYIGYFTYRHFVNSIGWPVALILLGIAFIAVSSYAWRIKRRYIG